MNTLQTIIEAIRTKSVLTFTYSGLHRVVEPHAVGISRAGHDSLRCYQISGGHVARGHEWDFCTVSQISDLVTTETNFAVARPGYARDDKHMTTIYEQL